MAKRVEYQEMIDLDGYKRAVQENKEEYKLFVSEVMKLNKQMQDSILLVRNELEQLRKGNASTDNGKLQEEYGKRAQFLSSQIKDQRDASSALAKTQEQLEKITGSLIARQEQLLTQYASISGNSAKEVALRKRLAQEIVNNQSQLDKLDKSTRLAVGTVKDAVGSYNKLQKELAEARAALKSLNGAFDENTGKLNKSNSEAVALAKKIEILQNTVRKADSQMGIWSRNVGNYPQIAQKGFDGLTLGVTRMAAAFFSVDAILTQGKAMVKATSDAESLSAALKATHESADEAARSEQFLYKTADVLGAEIESTSEAFISLSGATKGSALEGDGTRRLWNALITAGKGLRRSNEEIQRSVVATSQIFSKQKVLSEELVGQLAEALPGSLQILSKELGVSTSKMLQMASEGKLLALDVLPKLAEGLEKAYGGSVAESADTIASNTNRMHNAIQALRKTLFEETGAKNWFTELLKDEIEELKDWIYFFKNFKELRLSTLGGGGLHEQRVAADNRASTYDSFRQLSTADMQRTIDLQEQSDLTAEQKAHLEKLRQIYKERLASERRLAEDTAKQRWEQGQKQREKEKKDRDRQAKKEDQEAEARLRESIAKNRANTATNVSGIETTHASGGTSDVDFLNQRTQALQDGVLREQEILRKAGKQNTVEYEDTQKQLNEIAADYIAKRNKIEEDAFRKVFDATKEAISGDEGLIEANLKSRLSDLEVAYDEAESNINIAVLKRQITQQEGAKQIRDLQLQYLGDVTNATLAATDTEKQVIERRIVELKAQGKTQAQIDEAVQLEIEATRKASEQADIARDKREVDRKKQQAKTKEELEREHQENVRKIQDAALANLSAAVSGYFSLRSALAQQDLDNLDKAKEYEISLSDGSDAQKQAIEQKYAQRQKEIRRKQTKDERAAAIFSIAISTAKAIAEALPNLALSILAGTLGGIEAAFVASQPLPQYKDGKGTSDNYQGFAIVGEAGYELIESKKSGRPQYRLAAQKQITYLNAHDRVMTHEETKRFLKVNTEIAQEVRTAPGGSQYIAPMINVGPSEASLDRVVRAIESLPIEQTILTDGELRKYTQKKNQRTEWHNSHFSLPKSNRRD